MNYKVSAEVKTINPSQATYILENCHFEFQRDTNTGSSRNWIDFLATQMIKDRFHPTSPLIFAISEDNKFNYLLNGYHTLKAVIKSGRSFDMVVSTFHVENKKKASVLYTHIDIGKNRTGSQRLSALEMSKELDIKHTYVGKATSALRYIINGFPNHGARAIIAIEDEVYFLREWKAEIYFFFEIHRECVTSDALKKRVLVAPILATSLVVLRHDFDNANTFLKGMIEGAGLNADSPMLKLRDRLLETKRGVGISEPVTSGYLSRAFARAWNSFVDGRPLSRLRVSNSEAEKNIILKNTPLDGSKNTFLFIKEYFQDHIKI